MPCAQAQTALSITYRPRQPDKAVAAVAVRVAAAVSWFVTAFAIEGPRLSSTVWPISMSAPMVANSLIAPAVAAVEVAAQPLVGGHRLRLCLWSMRIVIRLSPVPAGSTSRLRMYLEPEGGVQADLQ